MNVCIYVMIKLQSWQLDRIISKTLGSIKDIFQQIQIVKINEL